jgi:hypothetical protein
VCRRSPERRGELRDRQEAVDPGDDLAGGVIQPDVDRKQGVSPGWKNSLSVPRKSLSRIASITPIPIVAWAS